MNISAFETQNNNYLLNVDDILFLYVDKNYEVVLREISEREFRIAYATWAKDTDCIELEVLDVSEEVEVFISSRYSAYKKQLAKFQEELTQVNFFTSDFYKMIYNRAATYDSYNYGGGYATDPIWLTDTEIYNLFKRFLNKESHITETICDIHWVDWSNSGGTLFPVEMEATLLPNGKYYIEIHYWDEETYDGGQFLYHSTSKDEYIYEIR